MTDASASIGPIPVAFSDVDVLLFRPHQDVFLVFLNVFRKLWAPIDPVYPESSSVLDEKEDISPITVDIPPSIGMMPESTLPNPPRKFPLPIMEKPWLILLNRPLSAPPNVCDPSSTDVNRSLKELSARPIRPSRNPPRSPSFIPSSIPVTKSAPTSRRLSNSSLASSAAWLIADVSSDDTSPAPAVTASLSACIAS